MDDKIEVRYQKFMDAVGRGDLVQIEAIRASGVNIHWRGLALELSAAAGRLDIVKYLVAHGANVCANSDQALGESAKNNHLEVLKFLIESGADSHSCDNFAMRMSVRNGNIDMVKYLMEHEKGVYSFDVLINACSYGKKNIVQYILENWVTLDQNSQDSALYISAKNGHIDLVKYWIKQGGFVQRAREAAVNYPHVLQWLDGHQNAEKEQEALLSRADSNDLRSPVKKRL